MDQRREGSEGLQVSLHTACFRYAHCSHCPRFSLQLIYIMAPCLVLLVVCGAFLHGCSTTLSGWFGNVSTSLFSLSGDILLGGLFPINLLTSNLSERKDPNNITCGRYWSSVIRYSALMCMINLKNMIFFCSQFE